jgi:pimeloyl-ACP methyl ester carboxylesterase
MLALTRSLVSALALSTLFGSTVSAQTPSKVTETSDEALVQTLTGFSEGSAVVDGVRLHYVTGGEGPPLVLLPGWPETWWSFHKVMPALAKGHRVIVVDLRGMGGSDKPAGGYDKKTMAGDVLGLLRHLGFDRADIVGHDIGAQVAFSYAANFPQATRRLVMLDVPHPDAKLATWPLLPGVGTFGDKVGDGSHAFAWWFAFHQVKGLPEMLEADGRSRLEQDWFFHYLTVDDRAIDERDRNVYASAYRSQDAIRAGNAWYQAFPQDIVDDGTYAKLTMPVLGIAGPGYFWLQDTLARHASDVRVVKVEGSGHFLAEEKPDPVVGLIEDFLR